MKLIAHGTLGLLFAVLFVLLPVVPMRVSVPVSVRAAGNNWMKHLNGSLLLSQFSIPGTHDSGALYEPLLAPRSAKT